MWNESDRQTALTGLGHTSGAFTSGRLDRVLLAEQPFVELTNLRGDPASPAFMATAHHAMGIVLPIVPNTVAEGAYYTALWLAPDEWLVRTRGSTPTDLAQRLDIARGDGFFAVTDQSSGYSVVDLSGPYAREVLAKGCPLDLHPRAFSIGQCAQTHYFKTSVLLRRLDLSAPEAWEVVVRRSFADYAVRMMVDALTEYL